MSELLSNSEYPPFANEEKNSIFEYYSVKGDIDFLKKIQYLPIEERRLYLEENVIKFLGEFVGEVPYTQIHYLLKFTGLEYGGINILKIHQDAACLTGENSREMADLIGYEKMQKDLLSGRSNIAIWLSPPITSDYGFAFLLASHKDGKVSEYILRYDEKKGQLEKSNAILTSLNPWSPIYHNPEDFMKNPITYLSPSVKKDLETLLTITGVDQASIHSSLLFEESVRKQLSSWIQIYIDKIIELSEREEFSPLVFNAYEKELKLILAGIYNEAQELKERQLRDEALDYRTDSSLNDISIFNQIYQSARSRSLQVSGGGCPPTKAKEGQYGFISAGDIINALINPMSVETLVKNSNDYKNDPNLCRCSATKDPHFHCPGKNETCRHPIIVGRGIRKCPACGQEATCA